MTHRWAVIQLQVFKIQAHVAVDEADTADALGVLFVREAAQRQPDPREHPGLQQAQTPPGVQRGRMQDGSLGHRQRSFPNPSE